MTQVKAFKSLVIIESILFAILLALALYNTYFFLYKQNGYRILYISCFYAFSYVVISVRLAYSIVLAVDFFENNQDAMNRFGYTSFVLQLIATYAKICLGFYQVVAIILLTLQVK